MKKSKNFFKGFVDFMKRGNIVQLAIAFIMGVAFNSIVKSFVDDILMPLFIWIFGGKSFENLKTQLSGGADPATANYLNWGKFLTSILNFVLIAFFVYIILVIGVSLARKAADKLRAKEEEQKAPEAPAEDPADIKLLKEINESLKRIQEFNGIVIPNEEKEKLNLKESQGNK